MPEEPASAYPAKSWLNTFMNNEHRAAAERRVAAGLGISGVPNLPRGGVNMNQNSYHGDSAV